MESPRTRTPIKPVDPLPIAQSPGAAAPFDQDEYAPSRCIPMRPAPPDDRYPPDARKLYQDASETHHCAFEYGPAAMQMNAPTDVKSVRSSCTQQLHEVLRLQRLGSTSVAGPDLDWRIRSQRGLLLAQLKTLQAEVRKMAKAAQNHRWRRWLIGGFIATFVPIIRRLFRRGTDIDSASCSNNTEFAFRKSKGLIARIKDSVLRHGRWASVAFFVFAVLFVFSNEVLFRVSKTVYKRLRKMVACLEGGQRDVDERDLKALEGWRWRVMLW